MIPWVFEKLKNFRHYGRVYLALWRISLNNRLAYPLETVMSFGTVAFEMILYFIFANVMFRFTPTLGGFSQDELFFMMGTGMILEWLSWWTFRAGAYGTPTKIQRGKIDYNFVKPLPLRMACMFERLDIEDIGRLVIAIILIWPHRTAVATPFLGHILLYVLAILLALICLYSALSLIVAVSFIFVRTEGLFFIQDYILILARYPYTIIWRPIRWVFLTIFPVALFGALPTLVLTRPNWGWVWPLVFLLVWTPFFLWISGKFWNYAARSYSGTSS